LNWLCQCEPSLVLSGILEFPVISFYFLLRVGIAEYSARSSQGASLPPS
jgi:hypothetical protein